MEDSVYDGPEAPPVFVVLESDLEAHEINKNNSKRSLIEPIKNIGTKGMHLPLKGGNAIRSSSKKLFEEKESPRLPKKHKRRSVTKLKNDDKSEIETKDDINGDQTSKNLESLLDNTDTVEVKYTSNGELIFPMEGHDIIIPPDIRTDNNLGKKVSFIRKEAMKRGGKAGTYLLQVPRSVSNGVEVTLNQTTQRFKDAVNTDILGLASQNNDEISPRIVKTRETSKRTRVLISIKTSIDELTEKYENQNDNITTMINESFNRHNIILEDKFSKTIEILHNENNNLLKQLDIMTEQSKNTINLLETTKKRMDILEERLIAVQKSQINQITLFDFIFIIINYIIQIFSVFMNIIHNITNKQSKNIKQNKKEQKNINKNTKSIKQIMNDYKEDNNVLISDLDDL